MSNASPVIIIEKLPHRLRVGLQVGGELQELHYERTHQATIVDSVYRGKVMRVLPSMQAAFVDIGLEQNAFLHVRDLIPLTSSTSGEPLPIEQRLHEGQPLLVQASKAPRGTSGNSKGAVLTEQLKLVSSLLVFLPLANQNRIVLSNAAKAAKRKRLSAEQQIQAQQLEDKLTQLLHERKIPGTLLLRETALLRSSAVLAELDWLVSRWKEVAEHKDNKPGLISAAPNAWQRMLIRYIDDPALQVQCNDAALAKQIEDQFHRFAASSAFSVRFVEGEQFASLSEALEQAQALALTQKVPLENGANLVFQTTEALTVVDVNTAAASNQRASVPETNRLAVHELARQLRLRNIGGIVIVDFINQAKANEQRALLQALDAALAADPVPAARLNTSELSLVEITRRRSGTTLAEQLQSECACCAGLGFTDSVQTICDTIMARLYAAAAHTYAMTVEAAPEVIECLQTANIAVLQELQDSMTANVTLNADPLRSTHNFDIAYR